MKMIESLLVNEPKGYTVHMDMIATAYVLLPDRPWSGLGHAGVHDHGGSFVLNVDTQAMYVRTFGQFSGAVPGRSVPISRRLRT